MKSKLQGKKILFATVPTDGHFNPLTGLAKYLQEAGCDVRWYTSPIYTDKLKKLNIPHYPFVKALDINGTSLHELVPEIKTNNQTERSKLYIKHLFVERSVEYDEDIRQIFQSFPFDLMVADSMFTAIPLIKHKLNVPVVSIGIIPLNTDSVDTAPYKAGLPPAENEVTRTAYAKMYHALEGIFHDSIDLFTSILTKNNIPFERSFYFNILNKSADLYLQIGTPDFEYERSDLDKNVRFIGALMPYSSGSTHQNWYDERLKKYSRVLLVTQGTMERDVTKLLEPVLKAFINTDILIIATTAKNKTEELRVKYAAENVIIEDFIPFADVMPYASVYVTNGGYGGVLHSIQNKLPMVAAGIHEGKIEICSRINHFKYGIDLKTETPSSEAIYSAVNEVMANDIYQKNITRLYNEFNTYHSNQLCASYIVELLEKTESLSYQHEY